MEPLVHLGTGSRGHVDVTNRYSGDARRCFQFGDSYSGTWSCDQIAKRRKRYDAVAEDVG